MEHFRKIWDKQKNDWIRQNADLPRYERYQKFIETFPDSNVSQGSFFTQCSVLGVRNRKGNASYRAKPLYSEHIKKGYVQIKIAQPNVWISKAQWVYIETHLEENCSGKSHYIFLDGNSRNFSYENIFRLPLRSVGTFSKMGGIVPCNPELTKLRALHAILKNELLDFCEKHNMVYKMKSGRMFKGAKNV